MEVLPSRFNVYMIAESLAIYILIALSIFLFVWIVLLEQRLKKFMAGKDGASLEDTMKDILSSMSELNTENEAIKKEHQELVDMYAGGIRGVSLVKYNPYSDVGGSQSFAMCFLDSNGDGAVLSTLHSRDKTRVFAKKVSGFEAKVEVSAEEQESIDLSRKKL